MIYDLKTQIPLEAALEAKLLSRCQRSDFRVSTGRLEPSNAHPVRSWQPMGNCCPWRSSPSKYWPDHAPAVHVLLAVVDLNGRERVPSVQVHGRVPLAAVSPVSPRPWTSCPWTSEGPHSCCSRDEEWKFPANVNLTFPQSGLMFTPTPAGDAFSGSPLKDPSPNIFVHKTQ